MSSGKRTQRGFTYLAMLIAVALIGVGLVAGSEVWSHSRQREKEQELLFIGEQFRRAIGQYYERTPGAVKRYPDKLQDLLDDPRFVHDCAARGRARVRQHYSWDVVVDRLEAIYAECCGAPTADLASTAVQ